MSMDMSTTLSTFVHKKGAKALKIKEFIDGHNISYNTVHRYIKRNEDLFNGHIGNGKVVELDDFAIDLLEKKYPKPTSVQIVEDTETKRQLEEAKSVIINLQQQLLEAGPKLARAEATQFYLDNAKADIEMYQSDIEHLKAENEKLRKDLSAEREKTWWQKLRKK